MNLKINKYLEIRQENGKTVIYVGDIKIEQCTLVLMNIPSQAMRQLGDFESIDELLGFSEGQGYIKQPKISSEEKFWAHSSAIQAWVELGYDTRLLDMRFAFPILKELTRAGDSIAKKRFKDEIFKRFKTGYPPVVQYLIKEGYLEFLTNEELETLTDETDKSHIISLDLSEMGLEEFPKYITKFESLKYLDLFDNKIALLPENIKEIDSLKELIILNNFLEKIPEEISTLKKLEFLDLRNNQLSELPDFIGNLKNLKKLWLGGYKDTYKKRKKEIIPGNFLTTLPKSICYLQSLESLNLSFNNFSNISHSLLKLKNLKFLDLSHNNITEIHRNLENLNNIEGMILSHNKLKSLPESIGKLDKLKSLFLNHNKIEDLPRTIGNLINLNILILNNNNLEYFPEDILNLGDLEILDLSENPLKKVPADLFELSKLKDLHLPSEKITPPDFFIKKFKKYKESKKNIWYLK